MYIGLYKNSYMKAKNIKINNEWFNICPVVIVITQNTSDVEHCSVHTEKKPSCLSTWIWFPIMFSSANIEE